MSGRITYRRTSVFAATVAAVLACAGSALAATHAEAPVITKFTPVTAKTTAKVTIDGKYFTGATAVKLDGMGMTFKVLSPTKIVATLSSKAKTGKISVTTKGGTAMSKARLDVT
jgi:hypothetical protein